MKSKRVYTFKRKVKLDDDGFAKVDLTAWDDGLVEVGFVYLAAGDRYVVRDYWDLDSRRSVEAGKLIERLDNLGCMFNELAEAVKRGMERAREARAAADARKAEKGKKGKGK